jgi:hypothetical protein
MAFHAPAPALMASDRERDSAGNPASTSNPSSAGKADQIVLKFFTKAALLVQQARATPQGQARAQAAGTHAQGRVDKWVRAPCSSLLNMA